MTVTQPLRLLPLFLFVCLAPLGLAQAPADSEPWEVLRNFARLRAKIERGLPIEVTYLGGSVTRGGTTNPISGVGPNGPYDYSSYQHNQDSWRAQSFQRLAQSLEQWPGQFAQNNCALGGTGSLRHA